MFRAESAIEMKNVDISMAKNPQSGVPVMSDLVSSMSGCGIYARNVKRLVLENVKVTGQKNERIVTVDVDEVIDD